MNVRRRPPVLRTAQPRYVLGFRVGRHRRRDARRGALAEAKDLLRELIASTIRAGEDLPEPSRARARGGPLVVPPVQLALKAAL